MYSNPQRKPKLSERLLSWCCKSEYLEEILGDLAEYRDELTEKPGWKRSIFYWFHVFNFLQPWALKSFEGSKNLNQYGMFKNYLKTSVRSLWNNALFSGVNALGLAIGMSVSILMILLLAELNTFDNFQEKGDRIYKVTSNKIMYGQELDMSTASAYVGDQIEQQVPGVDHVAIVREGMSADMITASGPIKITGLYATPSFFDVFSFDLLQGNPHTALVDPNSIVLTEKTAQKLFGDADPMGQSLTIESTGGWQVRTINAIVTGIVKNPPHNSHIQFESLVSMKTYDQPATGTGWQSDHRTNPRYFQHSNVYLVLQEQTQPEDVEAALASIVEEYNSTQNTKLTHGLQPLDTFVTSDTFQNRVGPRFSLKLINIMIVLTLIVLLSACFNYTNLSLARALKRSKEIGVRKVTGASRTQLFMQFIVEACLLSITALVLAIALFMLIKPIFLNMPNPASSGHEMFSLQFKWIHALYLLLFALFVGAISGLLPALFLSKLKALVVIKDASKVRVFSGISLRRMLSVLQFALSIGLIMCAVMVNKQYHFALNYDVGFDTENIVNIHIKGDYLELLESECAKIPEVLETSRSMMTMGTGGAELAMAQTEDGAQVVRMFWNSIDEKYLDMHGYELLAGSNFVSPTRDGASVDKMIINEHLLEALELSSPEEAIGKMIQVKGYLSAKLQVVGVVKNFVNTAINTENMGEIMAIKNFAFVQRPPRHTKGLLGVKFRSDDLPDLMQKLETAYKQFDSSHPFEAEFYEDKIAETYQAQKTTFTLISFLAFLAISISLLGLLGMAVFTTESRMKEISIRKVLGAPVMGLMILLSRNFLFLIIIAGLIAIPLAKYIVDVSILAGFSFRAETGLMDLLSGFIAMLLVAALTITWQVRQAAVRNPADLLRNE